MEHNNLTPAQKRKLTIQKKQQKKEESRIKYKEKIGEQRIKSIVEQRKETIQQKKHGLPNFVADYQPKHKQKSRDERMNVSNLQNDNNNISNLDRTELHNYDSKKFKKYIKSALNNAVREIIITNDEFSMLTLFKEGMNKDEVKKIDSLRTDVCVKNIINIELISKSIQHEILKSLYSTDNNNYNILTNVIVQYEMYKINYKKDYTGEMIPTIEYKFLF